MTLSEYEEEMERVNAQQYERLHERRGIKMREEEFNEHGVKSRLYTIHTNMKQRCQNPKASFFDHYGGRGISVCDQWKDYDSFKRWALTAGYEHDLTIDRVDNNGNYEPTNCQWITMAENVSKAAELRELKISDGMASEICEAYSTGMFTQKSIAEFFNVSRATICNLLKCVTDFNKNSHGTKLAKGKT